MMRLGEPHRDLNCFLSTIVSESRQPPFRIMLVPKIRREQMAAGSTAAPSRGGKHQR
jgi:hypothetical protein